LETIEEKDHSEDEKFDFKIPLIEEEPSQSSFIKKNIKTQGKVKTRYIEKTPLYKCDHRSRPKDYEKSNKKNFDKIQEERELRSLERIYHVDSSDDDDSKLRDLKNQYLISLQELAKAQNTIDALRFGNRQPQSGEPDNETLKVLNIKNSIK
jgi:hypothetical protein